MTLGKALGAKTHPQIQNGLHNGPHTSKSFLAQPPVHGNLKIRSIGI